MQRFLAAARPLRSRNQISSMTSDPLFAYSPFVFIQSIRFRMTQILYWLHKVGERAMLNGALLGLCFASVSFESHAHPALYALVIPPDTY